MSSDSPITLNQYGPIRTPYGPQGALLECFNLLANNRRILLTFLESTETEPSAELIEELTRRHSIHLQHVFDILAQGALELDQQISHATTEALSEYATIGIGQ